MAEQLLSEVLSKIAAFTAQTALSLYGIREEVERLSWELSYIQAFIKDVDKKYIIDERQMQWVKDVMDIAYQIEDAIDIFLLECPEKLHGKWGLLKRLAKRATQLSFLNNFKEEINKIQGRICEIQKFRERYGINTLGEDKIPQPDQMLIPMMGNSEVVGFDTDRDNVVKCLLDEVNRSLAVVSIVGTGGLGKTTLAWKVCNSNDVIERFGKPIWITISQKYVLLDILRKIGHNLDFESTHLDESGLANLIRMSLEKRRYLIVFDDVWTKDVWAQIAKVLPDTKNGSRVLMTTRIANVAKEADTTYDPYELPVLTFEQSLELFLRKAVPKKHQCLDGPPDDLKSLAIEFVVKCKGLPLAMIVLGGLLSTRPFNFHAWNELLHTMSWQDDGSDCTKIIATSYEHLPLAKKLCFLYFAAFIEDKDIDAKRLLRMWVAERLIPHEERRTLEDTAGCFLEDLVQRSIVQVAERFPDGSIKYCRVHDILRELAIQKAKEINFLMVCSKRDDWESCNKARRVAIHYSSDGNHQIGNYASPNVRSLLFFGKSLNDSVDLDCSKFRVLRVLGSMEGRVELQSFRGSPHLRYLQLNNNNRRHNDRDFGEWISSMKYLETLDLRSSWHGDLSNWIWQVKTLRHVLLEIFTFGGTKGPPASVELRYLQTLINVVWNESWETSGLPNIPEVRELAIQKIHGKVSESEVARLLGGLRHLVYFKIEGNVNDLPKLATRGFPFYNNLRSLFLIKLPYIINNGNRDDTLPLVLSDDMFPPQLTELDFEGLEFESDPMPILENLQSLNTLWILGTVNEKNTLRRIRCSAGGFKKLEVLLLEWLTVEEWNIEMGAMPMLKRLRVVYCDPLKVPPELIHLESLQHLLWVTNIQTNHDALSNIYQQRPHLRLNN